MPTLIAPPEVADAASAAAVSRAERVRVLALAAGGPVIASYAAVAALLALVAAATPGAGLSTAGVLNAAGPAWLAAFHVPVTLVGHDLGALPLLPTMLVLALVGRTAADATSRLGASTPASAVPVLGTIAVTHAMFGLLLAVVCSDDAVRASPVLAFFVCGVLSGLAAAVGAARRCGLLRAALVRADDVTRSGLRAGAAGVAGLLGGGALILAGALIGSWPSAVAVFRVDAPGVGAGLGMLLLSVAYLPNAVVASASFAAGPGFSVGASSFGPLVSHPGPVPALPLLAAVPTGPVGPHRWSMLLMLLPVAVGVLVGWIARRIPGTMLARCRAVGVAAICVALGASVLAALSGGALGGGRFDPVTVPAGLLAVSAFAWVTAVGSFVVWLASRRADQPEPESTPESVSEPADESGEPDKPGEPDDQDEQPDPE
ncbi:MAG TPA: DUF6350 family protein [Pseudonocardiaceae bacterium]|nr:DUF6350 family protein [Pseudonocardiaceae bacterium]